jgi:hypothetical protein
MDTQQLLDRIEQLEKAVSHLYKALGEQIAPYPAQEEPAESEESNGHL